MIAAGSALAPCSLFSSGMLPEITLEIVPCQIEVAPGHVILTSGYKNATGEVLRIYEGRPVEVEIHNQTLTREYVHWHGFSLDAAMDGTAEEESLFVEPGGRLRYTLPGQTAGSYYVHSHAMAHHDMNAGMYGGQFAYVYVQPKQDAGDYDREIFLTSHEWEPYMVNEMEEQRSVEEMHHLRIDPEEAEEVGEGGWDVRYRLASLNGKALGHGEPIRVKEGERILLHLLNASATENIQIALPGHEFLVQAMDGHRVPHPVKVSVLDLGVGERIDTIVEMSAPGVWILGSTDDAVRGMGLGVVIEYAGRQGDPVWTDVAAPEWDYTLFGDEGRKREGEEIAIALRRLPLTEDGAERWEMAGRGGNRFLTALQLGSSYRIRIANESNEWHPMHLHRHAFELTEFRGKATAGLMKDTIVVPPYEEVEMLVTPRQMGPALFHCHNQMHMDAGLQVLFTVDSETDQRYRKTEKQ